MSRSVMEVLTIKKAPGNYFRILVIVLAIAGLGALPGSSLQKYTWRTGNVPPPLVSPDFVYDNGNRIWDYWVKIEVKHLDAGGARVRAECVRGKRKAWCVSQLTRQEYADFMSSMTRAGVFQLINLRDPLDTEPTDEVKIVMRRDGMKHEATKLGVHAERDPNAKNWSAVDECIRRSFVYQLWRSAPFGRLDDRFFQP